MLQSVLTALIAPLALLTLVLSYLALTRRAADLRPPRREPSPVIDPPAEVARSVRQIEEVMQTLAGGIKGHAHDVQVYDDTLEGHRHALQSANSMRAMRDIERLLQDELSAMHKANEAYRQQLDAANLKIEEQRAQLEQLTQESTHDFLTTVPNRRAFDKRLHEEIDRFRRGGPPFSLVLVDIDHFKQVNDRHGHVIGDEVLQAVANLLEADRRATDFTARYGGEEFAMLLPCTGEDQACTLLNKIREEIAAAPIRTRLATIPITISAGVAEMLPADQGSAALIQRADDRLYRAKTSGRNCVCGR